MRLNRVFQLCAFICLAGTPLSARQPISFVPSTIDPNASGDCKALADLDGDGKADPIIGGGPLVWYEAGAGFAKRVIRASPAFDEFTTDMQAADLDGDGDIDLIIPDSGPGNTGSILWYENPRLNTPAGVTSNPRIGANWLLRTIGTQGAVVHDVEVADLDNDGKLDVVTSGHGITRLWKQVSPTSWTTRNLSASAGIGVSLGDIDLDGFKDMATPRGWLKNPQNIIGGTWTFFPINQATTGDECLLADLSGDGRPDILTCDAHNRAAVVWFQNPANATSAAWTKRTIDSSMGAHHPEVTDFNLDGRRDLLLGLELADVAVYINNGGASPTFTRTQLDTICGHNARVGDIDGDGFPDVLGSDWIGNPPARVYINQTVGQAPCYANCDASTGTPMLTPNDFQCFLNLFASANPQANCDGSEGVPVLTANDFQCFLNAFAAGCS